MKTLNRGFAKRALSVLLTLMMLFSLCTVGIVSSNAADVDLAPSGANFEGGTTIYLKPNVWDYTSAWFAAYFFNSSGSQWVKMEATAEEAYVFYAEIPSGSWTNVIFCRMDPAKTALSWDSRWNQTNNLTCDGDLFVVESWGADGSNSTGSWSTYVAPGDSEETGSNTATIYVTGLDNTSYYDESSYLYVWESSTNTGIGGGWPGKVLEYDSTTGYYYRTFQYDLAYKFIVNNNNDKQTDDPTVKFTASELLVTFTGDNTYTTEELSAQTGGKFWVDVDGDISTTTDIIYPSSNTFYLPSGVTRTEVTLVSDDDSTVTVNGTGVTTAGVTVDLSSSTCTVNDVSYKVMQSANVSSIHTTTEEKIPQGTGYGASKDDYNSENNSDGTGDSQFITVIGPDGTVKLEEAVLKKIKGRGNSSWEASNSIIGKYAFNITLGSKAKLLDESTKSKKYCLVSYNADEARMRNMVIYELAQQIGVKYVADYEPIDLYNNGYYIGSYLLTDKVEIGDPLVALDVNLDDINKDATTDTNSDGILNATLYDDDSQMVRAYAGSSSINETATAGFFKFITNLDEPDPSEYADSGFLLEFELNERFAAEISGFISTKGQQIVCKYPEYATYKEILFIMDKWNTAEALMYDDTATYEELDAVIDVESFAKMYLIQELSKNLDAGATSYYVYYDGGKLHAGVAWDYDWTLGQYIQSGDTNKSVANQTSGKFDSEATNTLENPEGWWANSKEIYPNTNVLNAQAALCQNENFCAVVAAEWNELFYSEALKFADSTISSVSELDGNMLEFYNLVHSSTEMDEDKWGLIWKDLLAGENGGENWGSKDTGDTHDAAVVSLNNFFYKRLVWMNGKLSVVDYTIQPPTVSFDKELYQAGETATLVIDDKTDGDYTYTIYKDGTQVDTTTEKTYTITAEKACVGNYTVVATSNNDSNKVSAASNASTFAIDGFNFTLDVTAPESVMVGNSIVIDATTNSTESVTYTLKDSEGNTVDTNTTGDFSITVTADDIGTKNYTLDAVTTVDGEQFTATKDITVEVTKFTFSVTLSAPESVEAGMVITLNATAVSNSTVTYTFYTEDGTLVAENTSGIYTVDATQADVDTIKSYYVVASTTVAGVAYTDTSDTVNVQVTAVKETYEVTLYFKSTSTLGYKPLLTTEGAVVNFTDFEMTKDTFICKNATDTASYYWYSAVVQVSKASPTLSVSILSSRYAMEGDIDLTITQSGAIYLAVDNLNEGYEMFNLTDWTETERNWTQSAVHMVYDAQYDTEESLAEVSARVNLTSVGDANGDGMVNIKDATLIQKFLASLETFTAFDKEISDINDDGFVTIKDATAIQKKIAGCL